MMVAQSKDIVSRPYAATRLGISERTLRRYLNDGRIRRTDGGIVAADIAAGRNGLRMPNYLVHALLHARLENAIATTRVVVEVLDQQRTRLQREDLQWLFEQARCLTNPARWLLLAVRLRHDDLSFSPGEEAMKAWITILHRSRALRDEAARMSGDIEMLAELAYVAVLRAVARAMERTPGRRRIQQVIERGGAGANRRLVRRERKRRAAMAFARCK